MPNLQKAVSRRVSIARRRIPRFLAIVNQRRVVIQVIRRVQIKVHDVIPQAARDALAHVAANGIRRAKVRRKVAQNAAQRLLIVQHLLRHVGLVQHAAVLVRPGVARNLVALGGHALEQRSPGCVGGVDGPAVAIVADDKEGCVRAVGFQLVEEVGRVLCRPVVVGYGDVSWRGTTL